VYAGAVTFSWTALVTWLVIGWLTGSITATLFRGSSYGYGRWRHLGIGLVGAVVGGALFQLLGVETNVSRISVSVQDLIAAFTGALILLAGIAVWKRKGA
jgi:uncharacterized membrane protein YeaQ/YmgE (transglycosylase-associated protein family)